MGPQGNRSVRSDGEDGRERDFDGRTRRLNCNRIIGLEVIGLFGNDMDGLNQEQIGGLDHIQRHGRLFEFSGHAGNATVSRLLIKRVVHWGGLR